jgi:putative thioredoxin
MSLLNIPGAAPAAPVDVIKDGTDRSFMADVIETSKTVPVIVDFWAPWCGPCKQLGPIIEKVVKAARGAVKLVKINTDENPAVAGQLRVQSIPAVYAFFQGRPVDAFVGALPESQIKQWVDRLVGMAGGPPGADDIEAALAEAKQILEEGDPQTASEIYRQVLEVEPANAPAYAGLVRCLMAANSVDDAKAFLDQAPKEIATHAEIASVRASLDLLDQTAQVGSVADLERRLARDPDDHEARYDLAMAHFAAGRREEAVDGLLDLVKRDRDWNEQAARKQLVKLFEAFGPTDKLTIQARRRLSSLLFS